MKSKATTLKQTVSLIKDSTAADWIDKQGVMERFPISNRALQEYRSKKLIPYAWLGGKIFYYLPGIVRVLEDSANRQCYR